MTALKRSLANDPEIHGIGIACRLLCFHLRDTTMQE